MRQRSRSLEQVTPCPGYQREESRSRRREEWEVGRSRSLPRHLGRLRVAEEEDRRREEEGREGLLYRYKGIVPIPSLGMMDDSVMLTERGFKAEIVNVAMNENSAEKNLQFNETKCKFMYIGKNKETKHENTLEVDSWKISYNDQNELVEEEGGKVSMNCKFFSAEFSLIATSTFSALYPISVSMTLSSIIPRLGIGTIPLYL